MAREPDRNARMSTALPWATSLLHHHLRVLPPSIPGPGLSQAQRRVKCTGEQPGNERSQFAPPVKSVRWPTMPETDQPWDAFGTYLRSQRQLAQLSLRQLAALTKVSNPYLSQIERGLHRPSINIIKSLAEALNLSVSDLLAHAADIAVRRGAGDDHPRRHPQRSPPQRHPEERPLGRLPLHGRRRVRRGRRLRRTRLRRTRLRRTRRAVAGQAEAS